MEDSILYDIALSMIDGVGGSTFKQLVNLTGSSKMVFETPKSKLEKIPGINKTTVQRLSLSSESLKTAEQILKKNDKYGIKTVPYYHDLYPIRLKSYFDSPPILYVKGSKFEYFKKTIAIVGTREASGYGKEITENIVRELKDQNVQIISGLAYGIDVAAHKAALKNGMSTVGVLANPLDGVYPESHFKIATEMQENGYICSEQAIGTEVKSKFFVARNRIIAALSDAVIVIESAKKGGSMVTAQHANNYNKEVFAVPGGLFQKYSEGPNHLISNQSAQIYTNTEALLEWMNWDQEPTSKKTDEIHKTLDLSRFTVEESQVLSLLIQKGSILIDDLAWQTQIPLNKLASILLNLEFQDLVKQSPGKKFEIKK